MAPISDIVRISIEQVTAGSPQAEFGRTLFLGVPAGRTIDATTTEAQFLDYETQAGVRVYSGTDQMETDGYESTDTAHLAATAYFSQSPYPADLVVGYWFGATGASAVLWGEVIADESATVTAIEGLSSTATFMRLGNDAVGNNDFASLSGATDEAKLQAAATELQAAMRSISTLGSVTVIYNPVVNRFVVEVPVANQANLNSFFSNAGGAADVRGASVFGLAESDTENVVAANRARLQPGISTESLPAAALTRIKGQVNDFYWVTVDSSIEDDTTEGADSDMIADWIGSISAWCATRTNQFIASSRNQALLTTETTSNFAQWYAAGTPRTTGFYSATADYKTLAMAATMSSVDFDAPGSLINPKFRQLTGRRPDDLTPTQIRALNLKHVNRLVPRGAVSIVEEGWTFANPTGWMDSQYWQDWFENALQTAVFNFLLQSPRVPYTDDGVAGIVSVITNTCEQGVRNGGIAAGTAPAAMTAEIQRATGNRAFDGDLPTGYLIYATPVDEVAQSDRSNRQGPPISVWVLGSGAINQIAITVRIFE